MIGDSALREVIRADALRTIARAHQQFPLLRLFGLLCRYLHVQQACLQQRHRTRTILVLRSLILTFDNNARRQVSQSYS